MGASKRFIHPSTYEFTLAAYASFDGGGSWTEAPPLALLDDPDPNKRWTGISDPVLAWDNVGNCYLVALPFPRAASPFDTLGIAVDRSSDAMARRIPSRAKNTAPAAATATEHPIAVIDAGPAPIDFIRRAQTLSPEVIDAGPTRVPAPHPKRPPALPLNPLRAGAAIARGALQQEAAGQVGGLAEPDADGGGTPKRPAGKKRAQRKAKPAGKKRPR